MRTEKEYIELQKAFKEAHPLENNTYWRIRRKSSGRLRVLSLTQVYKAFKDKWDREHEQAK